MTTATKILSLLEKLPEIEKEQKRNVTSRSLWGIKTIPHKNLMQLKNYLMGYYYHSQGNFKGALKMYTASLYSPDSKSVEYWRLLALE